MDIDEARLNYHEMIEGELVKFRHKKTMLWLLGEVDRLQEALAETERMWREERDRNRNGG